MTQNPHLKVNVVCGYYDLATPVYNAEYLVSHMGLRPDVRKNVILSYYKAGHMVYISKETDTKFKADAELFYQNALKQSGKSQDTRIKCQGTRIKSRSYPGS